MPCLLTTLSAGCVISSTIGWDLAWNIIIFTRMAQNGRPSNPQVEADAAAWYDAAALDAEKTIARRLNKAALDHVVYAPLGMYLRHFAWRKNVSGVARGPVPFFWGVSKTV